ncbi:MAG: SynChlorMet cassette protein ScmD [Pseudomonadota bacterium]
MSHDNKPLALPHVVFREEFDDWALLFDPDQGAVLGLDPVGASIWKLLDGTRTPADVLAALMDEYDEVPDEAADHLDEFIGELFHRGFVGQVLE